MKRAWRDGTRVREVELAPLGDGRWRVRVDDATFEVAAEATDDGRLRLVGESGTTLAEVTALQDRRFVRLGALDFVFDREASGRRRESRAGGLEAPMPGVVTRTLAAVGDTVRKGQPLVALEAMKMEHLVRAPRDGRVRALPVAVGTMVPAGETLAELEPSD